MKLPNEKGFSLIELITIIVIISILSTISFGSYAYMNRKFKLKNYANRLSSDINFSRLKSKELGERVVFVVANAGSGGQSWISGEKSLLYFAYVDNNHNLTYDSGSDDILLLGHDKGGIFIDSNSISGSCISNGKCILFFPVGTPLIGSSDFEVNLKGKLINSKYSVVIRAITGVSHVEKK